MNPPIAIIGLAGIFPGAADVAAYWQNILTKTCSLQEAPPSWSSPYLDPDSRANNRIYSARGGFLGPLAQFNPLEFGVVPNSVEGADPDHFLALKVARDALADAGYLERPFDREKAGIILGRGTYMNRGFGNWIQHGLVIDQTIDILKQLHPHLDLETFDLVRQDLQAHLPPFNAQMSTGLVPNVVTGRIANRLDLMGVNYLVDAACASSLIAVALGIEELVTGRCDLMLAGGVQASTPPQVLMIFSQLGALSPTTIQPFGKGADGTLLSEGLGVLVLKRLSDAQRDGDRIYALLRGVGVASDGRGLGLLAPRQAGEMLSLERAYAQSGVNPQTIGLVEAHGTGMPLGDQTEIATLGKFFGPRPGLIPPRALGSVKSMIGHCIPAAGVASLIKMALSLYHRVLPPTLCTEVNPDLELEKTSFYLNTETRPWIQADSVRRAAVNAFGFGGINAHAILEEYPQADPPSLGAHWPSELLLCSGPDATAVLTLIDQIQAWLTRHPQSPLGPLAWTLSQGESHPCRLGIVARDGGDLALKLATAREKIAAGRHQFQVRSGIFYSSLEPDPAPTAFLFPGEGSQYPQMLADLALYFPGVRRWLDFADTIFAPAPHLPSQYLYPPPLGLTPAERAQAKEELFSLEFATALVFTSSMALYELLQELGIQPTAMVGHSTGENTALVASGMVRQGEQTKPLREIRNLLAIYRNLEPLQTIPRGQLLVVGALEAQALEELLADLPLYLAMDNCPNQVVLFGEPAVIDQAVEQVQAKGGISTRLPFDRGYHTPLFQPVAEALRPHYQAMDLGPGHTPVYSCATAALFPAEAEAIRELAQRQWAQKVQFRATIEHLYDQGFRTFIEVGPSSNLTGFVDDILRGREHLALASNTQRLPGLEQLQQLVARLFVRGIPCNPQRLYQGRGLDPVDLEAPTPPSPPPAPVLNLTMPVMSLSPQVVAALQQQLAPSGPPPAVPGSPPPLVPEQFPFLGEVLQATPSLLYSQRCFQAGTDLFFQDHTIGPRPSPRRPEAMSLAVMPFTMSLEILAQAATYLGGGVVVSLDQVRSHGWLSLEQGELWLDIVAQRPGLTDPVTVQLYEIAPQQPEKRSLVFSGRVHLAAGYPPLSPPVPWSPLDQARPYPWDDSEIYTTGMFHGPRFQTVRSIKAVSDQGIQAELLTLPTCDHFQAISQPQYRLDPALLDAAAQLVAFWVADRVGVCFHTFPFQLESCEQFSHPLPPGTRVSCRGSMEFTQARQITSRFEFFDDQGHLLTRMQGLREVFLRVPYKYRQCFFAAPTTFWSEAISDADRICRRISPLPQDFWSELGGVTEKVVAHLVLTAAERQRWQQVSPPDRSLWLLAQIAAKDALRQFARDYLYLDLAPVDLELTPGEGGEVLCSCPELALVSPFPRVFIHTAEDGVWAILNLLG